MLFLSFLPNEVLISNKKRKDVYIITFVKYPGGKKRELDIIRKYSPDKIKNYYEPFVGGGAVYFDITADKYFINDKSMDLIHLYNSVKSQDPIFFASLETISLLWDAIASFVNNNNSLIKFYNWYREDIINTFEIECYLHGIIDKFSNEVFDIVKNSLFCNFNSMLSTQLKKYVFKKVLRMKELEAKKSLPDKDVVPNIEGAFKAGFYMFVRNIYNLYLTKQVGFSSGEIAALYLFIRETTYSSMFRFNSNGEFNVPYGGISYNNRDFNTIISYYRGTDLLNKLKNTDIDSLDFEDFMSDKILNSEDFIFVDQPYDSEFSEYDQSKFDHADQERLADYLLNRCEGKFLMVVKNTDYIASLYPEGYSCKNGNALNIVKFDKKYSVSFMNRNNKEVEHLLIKNY